MSEDTRERILQAATREFSDKGFDGARVEAIAKRAGVNKALIYYYFRSKQELLKALYDGLWQAVLEKLSAAYDHAPPDEARERTHRFTHELLEFLLARRDLVRIIFMESLKAEGENYVVSLAEHYLGRTAQEIADSMRKAGMEVDFNSKQWLMTEFFTGLVPMICYALFREDVSERIAVSPSDADEYFIQSLKMTHIRTHFPE
ncbi:MAG: TetR/AcrR family transcriptional regulator [Spirochaetota bacterium]